MSALGPASQCFFIWLEDGTNKSGLLSAMCITKTWRYLIIHISMIISRDNGIDPIRPVTHLSTREDKNEIKWVSIKQVMCRESESRKNINREAS